MRHLRRRAPLAAAIGIVAAALTGATAQAGTAPHMISGPSVPPAGDPGTPPITMQVTVPAAAVPVTMPAAMPTAVPVTAMPVTAVPVTAVPVTASAAAAAAARPAAPGQAPLAATAKPAKPVCGPPYLDDDPNLGPRYLPDDGPLGKILRDYKPLNKLSPQEFIDRYWDESAGAWRYPQDYGFAHSGGYSNGKLLIRTVTLPVGTDLDRFGGEKGAFVSPLGASYVGRALPPSNLNTYAAAPKYLCSYHTYKVVKEFKVDGGPATAAFEQEGAAKQYHLVSKYIPEAPQTSKELSVEWLLNNGYLKATN
ncbi:TNT domain-containing protein [Streptosporangium sp. CA-135522]|uniref:TNT domain-containing protein n=1 Tax=Streptosporangium sp. CA-135522 TaxID=3240072 RepID=UPI003D8A0420